MHTDHLGSAALRYDFIFTVVRIGFVQTVYSAIEDNENEIGSEVEICVTRDGDIERSVSVYLTTSPGSAIGESINNCRLCV